MIEICISKLAGTVVREEMYVFIPLIAPPQLQQRTATTCAVLIETQRAIDYYLICPLLVIRSAWTVRLQK